MWASWRTAFTRGGRRLRPRGPETGDVDVSGRNSAGSELCDACRAARKFRPRPGPRRKYFARKQKYRGRVRPERRNGFRRGTSDPGGGSQERGYREAVDRGQARRSEYPGAARPGHSMRVPQTAGTKFVHPTERILMQATKRLSSAGQSIWLDNITRDLLLTG